MCLSLMLLKTGVIKQVSQRVVKQVLPQTIH